MIHTQSCKYVLGLAPISSSGTAATCTEVDTAGYHYATVIFQSGLTGAATYDELSVHASDTAGSGHTVITKATLLENSSGVAAGTTVTFTDPTDAGGDGKIWIAFLDLRKVNLRYLLPVVDPGAAASLMAVLVILSRADETPGTYSERGALETITV